MRERKLSVSTSSRLVTRTSFATLALAVLWGSALGQAFKDDANYRETYAIVNARIEIGNGQVIEKGTVLVKDGRIAQVGHDIQVPAYAYVIQGEKLTVYPGFIDSYSTQGLSLPEWQPDRDEVPSESAGPAVSMRKANRKGVRPELSAHEHLALTPQILIEHRKVGFTNAHLSPSGGILNGSGSLVNLNGKPARDCVLVPRAGISIGFDAPRGGYPNSGMGILAHIRQTFWDTEAQAPSGFQDESLSSLKPLLNGSVPALIDANESYEITRALRLSQEFNMKPVLVGGGEAFMRVADIKSSGAPVIVTLDWPAEPKPTRKEEEEKKTPEDPFGKPAAALEEEQSKWLERVNSAKSLSAAGVPIVFSTRGARNPAEFWKNLRRAIKEGLPRDVVLRALTQEPARLFGVESELGTVQAGKRANLTIMTGDFAKEDAKVTYMLIDGILFKPDKERVPRERPRSFNFEEEEPHPHP